MDNIGYDNQSRRCLGELMRTASSLLLSDQLLFSLAVLAAFNYSILFLTLLS